MLTFFAIIFSIISGLILLILIIAFTTKGKVIPDVEPDKEILVSIKLNNIKKYMLHNSDIELTKLVNQAYKDGSTEIMYSKYKYSKLVSRYYDFYFAKLFKNPK